MCLLGIFCTSILYIHFLVATKSGHCSIFICFYLSLIALDCCMCSKHDRQTNNPAFTPKQSFKYEKCVNNPPHKFPILQYICTLYSGVNIGIVTSIQEWSYLPPKGTLIEIEALAYNQKYGNSITFTQTYVWNVLLNPSRYLSI